MTFVVIDGFDGDLDGAFCWYLRRLSSRLPARPHRQDKYMPNLATPPRRLLLGYPLSAFCLGADESGPITTKRMTPKKKKSHRRFRRSSRSGNHVYFRGVNFDASFSASSSFLGHVPRFFMLCYLVVSYHLPYYAAAAAADDDDVHHADARHRQRCDHHRSYAGCSYCRSFREKICAELVDGHDGYGGCFHVLIGGGAPPRFRRAMVPIFGVTRHP